MKARTLLFLTALSGLIVGIMPASATVLTLVGDGFVAGDRTNGADANDIDWYSLNSSTGATANTVVNNANFTSGNAFQLQNRLIYP